ncbi:MAG: outer membrane lipoprotein carrier protein LolA [Gemmatimonadetes bacterium]|nr:MAG: outer membrane lipoprotein carrier protein LolA [Gemmatimonadota bacterium]
MRKIVDCRLRIAELRDTRRYGHSPSRLSRRPIQSAIRNPQSAIAAIGLSLALQSPDPWPILDRASAVYQTIASLSADFVQVVANPMLGAPDTTRGRLYQMRPSRFAMRFTDPKGDRIVADGRFLWLYTPSTTPGQVLRSRIPEYGSTGPNLIGQFVEHPRERYTARYVRVDSLAEGVADVVVLVPKTGDQPYSEATIWVSRDDALVRRLDIVEASGQRRTVMLREIRVNGGVPGRELTFSPPAGVRVVDQ